MSEQSSLRTKREIPQSELRRKLNTRLQQRGLQRKISYDIPDYETQTMGILRGVLGKSVCWLICVVLGLFIYSNTFFANSFSQGVVMRTESYLDGTNDMDLSWENFRQWVNEIRKNNAQLRN
ncbi:hypothetical protein HYG86_01865 [Alkalicella caledoniensis]|uniref:Uncharacterized protein n=1 Tax=Alkalicella caledoniensis TaxID=2731377 RepID=A0A7G9W4J0_ALKCA|nr:hypothetical protein [Alkalicella caledoniensis]QNO13602.1 hypothetical protein HYG86_01865 [Alkalicella caledoniensis]